ncbi:CbtB-domain containing protein [Pseudomonas fulva]|uniref:CbtB domain-containing protein n=1 Tax=Pseudomonas TaxID=286 RepID=UPI0011A8D40D|nr:MULTISPECIES: CbtB-domain containing protein [Pseudomonas]NIX93500.1 CbtB-domain containing protein [Pseudomonas fulva]
MPVTTRPHVTSIVAPGSLSQRIVVAVSASLLGLCLVYFAGFSHIEAVHNAAHDTRHSAAFPCH